MPNPHGAHEFKIDPELCSGHGRCYSLAPQWFHSDDAGYGQPIGRAEPDTPRSDMDFIVDSCPEEAISYLAVPEESGPANTAESAAASPSEEPR